LIAAACGPKAAAPTTPAARGTAAPAATACPTGDALSETASHAWNKEGGSVTAECVALRVGGETLWLIDGWYEPPEPNEDNMVGSWTALVTPAGEVRWLDGSDDLTNGMLLNTTSEGWTAVDLDGDGTEEALHVNNYNAQGWMSDTLSVFAIVDGKGVWGEALALGHDNTVAAPEPGEEEVCIANWEVIPGTPAQIAVTWDEGCEEPGRKLYRWNGKALVEW